MVAVKDTVGKYVQLARERHARDLATGFQRGLYFDQDAVDRVVNFFRLLRHHKGEWAGQRFELEDWQINDVIAPLFGWKRKDGSRRFRHAYIEVPRKNGKTELAAGLGVYFTFGDHEPGAEVYSAATKRDQAKISWSAAEGMIKLSTELARFARIYTGTSTIFCPRTLSKFQPLSSDSDTMDGLNPHAAIIDELHAHRDRRVYDVIKTALASRRQPMIVIITTAGMYRPESIGWEQHQIATQILEGALEDDSIFAYIASAEKDDDWTQPDVWREANPNWGVSVKPEYLEEQYAEAVRSPSFLNEFLRLHLGLWTQSVERWLSTDDWNKGNMDVDADDLVNAPAYGGLDLSSTIDLTALALVFPDEDGYQDVICRFWCPEERIIERSRRDLVPYDAWARDGWLTATEGNVVDYNVIRRDINEIGEMHDIVEIGFDPWNASQLTLQLAEDGFQMIPVRQGFASLTAPSKELEKSVVSGHLMHGGHPILRWCASNVSVSRDAAGNIKPDKAKSTEKIDGISALVMAIDRATRHEIDSVYPDEGLFVV